MKDIIYSVIIPTFNEEEVIEKTYEVLIETMNKTKESYELIFINDGSTDNTLELLKSFAKKDSNVKIINFSRNFGQQKAVTAGLDNCSGKTTIMIDADLQDPPHVILQMIEKWKEGFDIVYGKRLSRDGETFFKKQTSKWFYQFLNLLSDVKVPLDAGDFRLLDRKVVDEFKKIKEQKKYVRGYFSWVGFKTTSVSFNREARFAGKTKYNLKSMFKLAFDGIFSFSNKPLKLPLIIGILVIIFSLVMFIVDIVSTNFVGIRFDVVYFLIGLMFLSNGVQNKYIELMNDNIKARPSYIVDEFINFENK